MRKSGFLALAGVALLGLAACQKAPQLTGILPLEDSTKIYLYDISGEKPERIDSTEVNSNMFAFKGTYTPGIYMVHVPRMVSYTVELSATETASVVVMGEIENTPVITCPNGEQLTQLESIDAERTEKTRPLVNRFKELSAQEETPEIQAEILKVEDEYNAIKAEADKERFEVLLSMPKGAMAAYMLKQQLSDLSDDQIARVSEWIASLDEAMKGNVHVQAMQSYFDTEAKLQPGKPFIDFTATGMEGESVKLSDYAGKGSVILLEMWASWCPYCRQANPSLVEVYKEFSAKGYNVFGISLDKDHDEWKKAVEKDELPWPNFVFQPNDHPGDLYNVRGIPANVLFDREGKIVARNVDATQLREHLTTLLAQ